MKTWRILKKHLGLIILKLFCKNQGQGFSRTASDTVLEDTDGDERRESKSQAKDHSEGNSFMW